MKLTLNTESSGLLIQAKEHSGLNFNELLKEAMQLLVDKYKHEGQNDQQHIKQISWNLKLRSFSFENAESTVGF
jgi:hypothetical protein